MNSYTELRLFGCPGTGKTTRLAQRINTAVDKFGSDAVIVSSYTRTAAHEIASRGIDVDREHVGTLHALCFRALGTPTLTIKHLDEWNDEHPALAISRDAKVSSIDDPYNYEVSDRKGDSLYADLSRFRALMRPVEAWPDDVRQFGERWQQWKTAHDLLDFTDLIETCYRDGAAFDRNIKVGFFDEAQDFSRLQSSLVRKFAESMSFILLAGDDDQILYNFAGATPDAFLDPPIPDKQKEVLAQSYRVPRAVHRIASQWITRVTRREEKPYEARDADGEVVRSTATFQAPAPLMREIDAALKNDQTIMILSSCSYQLHATIQMLRDHGIPYHNPFRATAGSWNPIRQSKKTVSTAERLRRYLVPNELAAVKTAQGEPFRLWSARSLAVWSEHLTANGLMHSGTKARLKKLDHTPRGASAYVDFIAELFEPDEARTLLTFLDDFSNGTMPSLDWFKSHIFAGKLSAYRYPMRVAEKRGTDALIDTPRVIVGTIHSVKGGEADVVALFPDLSQAGAQAFTRPGTSRDSVYRQFYVGMTRARVRLVLCNPATPMRVNIPMVAQ